VKEQIITWDLIVIGGGAAGFFTAIQCAEFYPAAKILIIEKSNKVLAKVKISGGGRCNVTHACFEPKDMITNYPRGMKELSGTFYKFLSQDMVEWLDVNGVPTKIESDGRIFPVSNDSQSIIDCFLYRCKASDIKIKKQEALVSIKKSTDWFVKTSKNEYRAKHLMLATGSSAIIWKLLNKMGYAIVKPVPSLFTFNISHPIITGLAGVSVTNAHIQINDSKFREVGPLLITHWGLSGPAILKLSSWAARDLHDLNYEFSITVNWVGKQFNVEKVQDQLKSLKTTKGKRNLSNENLFNIPKRLWSSMLDHLGLNESNIADLTNEQIKLISRLLCEGKFIVKGKSTFKDEFVTCGGIDNKQVNFKTMESKMHPCLYFAGEILNIDAITGGFNFQAAWTLAHVAAASISNNLETHN
jgi:predicted Rossmann fold flavoprotein